MELNWPQLLGAVTASGGIAAYVTKLYFDSKFELVRMRYSRRFEALFKIQGMLADTFHFIEHMRNGDEGYDERSSAACMAIRQIARDNVAVVGDEIVDQVKLATDIALEYVNSRNEDDYDRWVSCYIEVKSSTSMRFF